MLLSRYHAISASQAYSEWQKAQEQLETEYDYDEDYDEDYGDYAAATTEAGEYYEDDDMEESDCIICDEEQLAEEQSPRFFFGFIGSFITRRACCPVDETRQATTLPPTGPRMKNATRCGRKSYQRILGGVVTKENEFPWQCALLNTDMSYFGCSAVLLSCDPVIIVSAAHCFREYDSRY